MKNLIYYIYATLIGTLLLTSCDDYLDVDIAKDQIDVDKVFNDNTLATAALLEMYTLSRNNGFLSGNTNGIGFLFGCYTDEFEVTDMKNSFYKNFYNNTVLSSNTALADLWNHTYKQIYVANNVIIGLENSPQISQNVKEQLMGEALAMRGILHFYLTQTFGPVPYITTTDYNINKQVSKKASNEIMNSVQKDLENAEKLLTTEYLSKDRVRINKSVVLAFLARLHLYQENWETAHYYSEAVINDPNFTIEPLENTFLKNSQSAILQFKPQTEGVNTLEAFTYIFTSLPAPYGYISKNLLDDFNPLDQRKTKWLKNVGNDELSFHPFKYKVRATTSQSQEYSVVIRIEEMHLISAEASAELNDWDLCNKRLNALKLRAGLAPVHLTEINGAINAILDERRYELFCEFGHRFYDLKRRKRLSELSAKKENWNSNLELLPLPEKELTLNQNLLPQNPGY